MSKGTETRRRIISQAAALFNRRGYEGSSLQDLMKATGLEKGGIYRHFSSKEELAALAFQHAWNDAMAAREQDMDGLTNHVDRLKQYISNFVHCRPSVPGGCPLLNTAIDADDGNPVLRDHERKALKDWQKKLEAMIADGIDARQIRRRTDKRRLANLIIASLEGALMVARLDKSEQALHVVEAHLHDYIEREVRKGGPK